MTYELHPLCTLFPRLEGAELASLVADLRANGLREPITLHDGMVLDGGNRYRACLESGVEPRFVEFKGGNLVAFVLSSNLHRRHLSAGQQAAIVASAQDWSKAHTAGGDRKSDQSAILHRDSSAARAAESGASLRTQKMADKVAKASPTLAREVAHGKKSLPQAVEELTGKRPGAKQSDAATKRAPGSIPDAVFAAPDYAPSAEELADSEQGLLDELTTLRRVADADDHLAEALAMIKQRDALVAGLQSRIDGLLAENSELVRSVKYWRRQAEKAAAA